MGVGRKIADLAWTVCGNMDGLGEDCCWIAFLVLRDDWCTFNKRLRTGTDKGNLTV